MASRAPTRKASGNEGRGDLGDLRVHKCPSPKRRSLRSYLIVSAVTFLLAVFPAILGAAPFDCEFTFPLPNGQSITLHGRGDDFSAVFETLDGYTVVFDQASRFYHYAVRGADGRLAPSGLVPGVVDPAAAGIPLHVRADAAVERADRQARSEQWEQETGIRERWGALKTQHRAAEAARRAGGPSPAPPTQPTVGDKVGLTLLVDFSDQPGTIAKTEIESFVNGDNYTGFGNNGSVKAFYYDNSAGQLTYINVVVGYIRVPKPKTYYDDPSRGCGSAGFELLQDAIAVMKGWTNYDSQIRPLFDALTTNASNEVLATNVYYAGTVSSPWSHGLWPRSMSGISPVELWAGGKKVRTHQITDMGSSLELGTFCHENGHMLCGFPDLYDYGYDSKGGAGKFCLMDYGGSGTNPIQVCAYLKLAAGWATTVTDVPLTAQTISVPAAGGADGNVFFRYLDPVAPDTEYFLVENRQAAGRDASLPASGIAVWHIDELGNRDDQRMAWNSSHENYECSLEQADNLWHFQNDVGYGDARDLFYAGNTAGGYANAFNDATGPSARWWNGAESGLSLSNFSASGATMTLTACDATSAPPEIASFFIENDIAETHYRNATLQSACVGVTTFYQASELADFSGAGWLPYSPTVAFKISSPGAGTKTVYFKAKNRIGESSVTSDTITLIADTPSGSGTQSDPYQISQLAHLAWMSDNVTSSSGKFYRMISDLDASPTAAWLDGFRPIGEASDPFCGSFDGGACGITGLTVHCKEPQFGRNFAGLFGRIGFPVSYVVRPGGAVSNLSLVGGVVTGQCIAGALVGSNSGTITNCSASVAVTVDGGWDVGGLVGSNEGAITNCTATGAVTVTGKDWYHEAGGLVGANGGPLSNCSASGAVTGNSMVGGLVGIQRWGGTNTNCFASGAVTATGIPGGYVYIGGLAGINVLPITNCYATGAVTVASGAQGELYVGGLVGLNQEAITTSYATGAVTATRDYVGGLAGYNNYDGAFTDCYWDSEATGQSTSAGSAASSGKTTTEMRQQATFAGWDFTTVWGIAPSINNGYPHLRAFLPPSVSFFVINGGAPGTGIRIVTLNNVCSGAPDYYQASESPSFSGASWQTYSTAPSFQLSPGNGTKGLWFKARNFGGESNVTSDTIVLTEPPTVSILSIANGATSTINRTVTLNNVCANSPTEYVASEDASFSGASWQAYSGAPSFILSAGRGNKSVYFKVRNAGGESGAATDTIVLKLPPATWTLF